MNTPEKNQIGTSRSKFEDSPVFNYLSNLSPIKPVKSAPITQTFNSLNFSSLPSIFTSPHVSSQKGSKLLRRHSTPSKSKSEYSYTDATSNKENEVFVDVNELQNHSNDLNKESGEPDSLGEARHEYFNAECDQQIELYQCMKYNCCSPESDSKVCVSAENNASYPAQVVASSAMIDQGDSISRPDMHKSPSGWESLLSDGADLLMFDSPNIAKDLKALFKSPPVVRVGSSLASQFPHDNSDFLELDSAFLVDVNEFQSDVRCAETEMVDSTHSDYPTMVECLTSHPSENVDDEPMATLQRGLHRRCLVFDANAAKRKILLNTSISNPSMCMQSYQNVASTSRKSVMSKSCKTACSSSLSIVSGIGLHLNTLATSGDNEVQVCVARSATSFQSSKTALESIHDIFTETSLVNNADSGVAQDSDDVVLAPGQVSLSVNDFNQNSPRKKRQKSEGSGDESCKRCNCKKSKCLKLYCECFAAGVYCIGTCACQDCHNTPAHEETVLATRIQIESRNPLAFAPKVIRTDSIPDAKDEVMNTPSSARHKRGCNCKKSSCQKKYCECYQGGVGCSVNCRCETCKNVFGTKDGSVPVSLHDDDDDDEETEKVEKKMNRKGLQNIEEHNPNAFPTTPLRLSRVSTQQPFSSKGKPPRSSFLAVGSASGLNTSQKFVKPNHFNPPPKFQRNYSAGEEEMEIPGMLRSNGTPNSIVKTSSPNSKRVSSPHSDFGSSSGRRSTRKLILQSIPSFPSLTQP